MLLCTDIYLCRSHFRSTTPLLAHCIISVNRVVSMVIVVILATTITWKMNIARRCVRAPRRSHVLQQIEVHNFPLCEFNCFNDDSYSQAKCAPLVSIAAGVMCVPTVPVASTKQMVSANLRAPTCIKRRRLFYNVSHLYTKEEF